MSCKTIAICNHVSEYLGHRDVAFTMNTYITATYEAGQIEMEKLDNVLSGFMETDALDDVQASKSKGATSRATKAAQR